MSVSEDLNLERFRFRALHANILIGMASDRYGGWIGQIYSQGRYENEITRRVHTVGGKPFVEEVLPVRSVGEYFEHFPVLEIDYTFYRLLLEGDGKPTQNYHVLKQYSEQLRERDRLILKVPQIIFARRLRKAGTFIENSAYLDAAIFTNFFYTPAQEILGENLGGFIFEQEYHPKKDRLEVDELAKALDSFFGEIPRDSRYHVELRTESYLADPLFEVLEKYGVGLILSHWTWLPPLSKQFSRSGQKFLNSGGQCILRLITPFRMSYDDSYGRAFPFNRLVNGMMSPEMLEDTIRLMEEAIKRKVTMMIIINNRAGGNGPLIARRIGQEFLARQH